jgi:hypothetical protein
VEGWAVEDKAMSWQAPGVSSEHDRSWRPNQRPAALTTTGPSSAAKLTKLAPRRLKRSLCSKQSRPIRPIAAGLIVTAPARPKRFMLRLRHGPTGHIILAPASSP